MVNQNKKLMFSNLEIVKFKDLIQYLRNNERQEKPSFMPNPLGEIMARCWENDPKNRPGFGQLLRELGKMLMDNDVQNH